MDLSILYDIIVNYFAMNFEVVNGLIQIFKYHSILIKLHYYQDAD